MRRRLLPRILALGALVLALAGCVRVQAELRLEPDDTVDGQIVVAVALSDDTEDARSEALDRVGDIESALLGSLGDAPGVSTSAYDEDGYLGSRITLDGVALDAFSGQRPESFRFVREDDEYVFTGVLDFTAQSIPDDGDGGDESNLTVAISFPGEVAEHNGELDGQTVRWSTTTDERVEMRARGAASAPGVPALVIVLVIAGLLVLVAAAVLGVWLVLRKRTARGGTADAVAGAGGTADAVAATPGATDAAAAAPLATPDPATPMSTPVDEVPTTEPDDTVDDLDASPDGQPPASGPS